MRRDKPDGPTAEIAKGLRDVGVSVEYVPGGNGRPDLLLGWKSRFALLVEVKSKTGKLSPAQEEWRRKWRGPAPVVVRTLAEAFAAVAAVEGGGVSAWMP